MQIHRKILTSSIIFITAFLIYWFFSDYVTVEWLRQNKIVLKQFVASNYISAVSAFVLLYAVYTAFSLPGASLLTVAAGFLFKPLIAFIVVNGAATFGSTLSFLFSRYIFGEYIQKKYFQQLQNLNTNIEQYGQYYFLLLRLLLVVPFFIVNVIAGLTTVSLWTFIWTTSVGIIPGSLIYIFAGRQLNELESFDDIVSWKFLVVLFLVGILVCVPLIFSMVRTKKD